MVINGQIFSHVITATYSNSIFIIIFYLLEMIPIIRYSAVSFDYSIKRNSTNSDIIPALKYLSFVDYMFWNRNSSCTDIHESNVFSSSQSLAESCVIDSRILYSCCAFVLLMLIYFLRLKYVTKDKIIKHWEKIFDKLCVNAFITLHRTFSQAFFQIYAHYLCFTYFFIKIMLASDYVNCLVALVFSIIFSLMNLMYLLIFRHYSVSYPYDFKMIFFDSWLLGVKIISSLGMSLIMLGKYENLIVIDIIFIMLILIIVLHEYFFNSYLTNRMVNYFKQWIILFPLMIILLKFLNFLLLSDVYNNLNAIWSLEYLIIILLSVYWMVIKYLNKIAKVKDALSSNCIYEISNRKRIDEVIEELLFYVIIIQHQNKLRVEMNYGIHFNFFKCDKFYGEDCMCWVCKLMKDSPSSNRNTDSIGKPNEIAFMTAVNKFLKKLDTTNNYFTRASFSNRYTDLRLVNYFYLNFIIKECLHGRNLFPLVAFNNQILKMFPNSARLKHLSTHLKLEFKIRNPDYFQSKIQRTLLDHCKRDFLSAIHFSNQLVHSLIYQQITYKDLLFKYVKINDKRDEIKKSLHDLGKIIGNNDRASFVSFHTMYRYLFNQIADKTQESQNFINDYIAGIDLYYKQDNVLIIEYNDKENLFSIVKTPSSPHLARIWYPQDVEYLDSFERYIPKYIFSQEKEKLMQLLQPNRTASNHVLKLFITDCNSFLKKVFMKARVCVTLDDPIKIYCAITLYEDKGLFATTLDYNILAVSEQFSSSFLITPRTLKTQSNISIASAIMKEQEKRLFQVYPSSDEKREEKDTGLTFELSSKYFFSQLSDYNGRHLPRECNEDPVILSNFAYVEDKSSSIKCDNFFFFKIRQDDLRDEMTEKSSEERNDEIAIVPREVEESQTSILKAISGSNSPESKVSQKRGGNLCKLKQTSKFYRNSALIKKSYKSLIIFNILEIILGIAFLAANKEEYDKINRSFQAIQIFQSTTSMIYSQIVVSAIMLTMKGENNTFQYKDFISNSINPETDPNYKIDYAKFSNEIYYINLLKYSNTVNEMKKEIYQAFDEKYIRENIDIKCELFTLTSVNSTGYQILPRSLFDLYDLYFTLLLPFLRSNKNVYGIEPITMANNRTYLESMNRYLPTLTDDNIERNWIILWINFYKNLDQNAVNVLETLRQYKKDKLEEYKKKNFIFIMVIILAEIGIFLILRYMIEFYKDLAILAMTMLLNLEENHLKKLNKKFTYIKQFLLFEKRPKLLLAKIEKGSKKDNEDDLQNNAHSAKNSQDILPDEYIINSKHVKLYLIIAIGVISFYLGCFIATNYTIENMQNHIPIVTDLYLSIKHAIDSVCYISISIMLNKTNIDEDYFVQKISPEKYDEMTEKFYQRIRNFLPHIEHQQEILDFVYQLKGKNMCKYIVTINKKFIDYSQISEKESDVDDTLLYLCNNIPIFNTDLISLLSYLNLEIRKMLHKFISIEKTIMNLKGLIDSPEMYFIQFAGATFIGTLLTHCSENIIIPTFNLDMNAFLTTLILVFTINIAVNVSVLFLVKNLLMDKLLASIESMNTIIGMMY